MNRHLNLLRTAGLLALALAVGGCSTAPKNQGQKDALRGEADAAVQAMTTQDPSLRNFMNGAHGYAVFPNIGKGGLIVGGSYGRGVVYEQGEFIGYADLFASDLVDGAWSAPVQINQRPGLDRRLHLALSRLGVDGDGRLPVRRLEREVVADLRRHPLAAGLYRQRAVGRAERVGAGLDGHGRSSGTGSDQAPCPEPGYTWADGRHGGETRRSGAVRGPPRFSIADSSTS